MRQHACTSAPSRFRTAFAVSSGIVVVLFAVALGLPARAVAADGTALSATDHEFFEAKVRPLLVEHCASCHSHEAGEPEGGLSFDSRADFLAAEGIAVAGHPDDSLIVKVVRYDGDLQMPPDGKLPAEEIRTIEEWVRRGLPWPDDGKPAGGSPTAAFDIAKRKAEHWCWQPPRAAPPPAVGSPGWCRSDIDRFVLARLEKAGLAPAPEAERVTLVRRAAAVLTGLPPDPADVDRVATSTDPTAFEAYVDELLASPQYGERFARHWLDVVRYGESRGHEYDFAIPNAWRYRDWVVAAFNDDLPYEQFVREQIAGDLLPQPRLDPRTGANRSVVGTGFWFLGEAVHAPVDIAQDEADRADNAIDTFGKAFLGLALGCARCHDHKFDAISNEDYYALAGMLMSSSYRQVPFESLEANQAVARRLEAADRQARERLLPLVAAVLSGFDPQALPASVAPQTAASETRIADYSGAEGATPIMMDGAAWRPVPAGQPVLMPAAEDRQPRIRLEPIGHAACDAVWARSRSTGERDSAPLGNVDRAGRVLRTPKVRVTEGVLWHRVRGHVQISVVVDGHVLLSGGPLYGGHLMTTDTKGDWRWVRQDLRKDLSWKDGRLVHVEYAAIDGAAAVAEVVAGLEQPLRPEPGLTAVNQALAATSFDWATPAATAALAEAERLAAERQAIVADAKLESATAPALLDGNGIDQYVLLKGSASRRGELSPRRFLEAIDGPTQPAWPAHSSGRLELAERVLAADNPLTARVIVNRVWHHLFGRGLVPTTDNFGKLGEATADPGAQALLDTLAVRFRAEGSSIKKLVREIVTGSTWRMASTRDPRAVERDPLNLLLHHYPLRRLEAEAIRDGMLAVSGRLDRTVGGPSVEVFLTDFHDGRGKPKSGPLDGDGRRSLYTRIRRNFLPSFLVAFDMPVPFQAMGRRNVTNVPAQALSLMNDPFVHEQSHAWAKRILADPTAAPEVRIDRMYREAFARPPAPRELSAASAFLAAQAETHGVRWEENNRHEPTWADLAHALLSAKEFIFIP